MSGRVQSLKTGSAAQILPVVVGYGTQLFTTPYVVSQLGLHDFGVWAITGAIAQYAALLDLGVSRAASRYVALFHAKGDTKKEGAVVGTCVAALAVVGVLLVGLALLAQSSADRLLGTRNLDLARLLLLSAVAITIIGLLARVFAAASIGRGRQVYVGFGVAALSTLQALGGVVGLKYAPSLTTFAVGTVTGTALGLISVIVLILCDERRITIGFPGATLTREILAYGVTSQIAAIGDLFLLQSGKLIAGIMLGPSAAGVYELASRLATGAQVFGSASVAALTPHLTRAFITGGMKSILNEYEHLTRRNTSVSIVVPLVLAATSFSAIPLWLGGDDHSRVIFALLALIPGILINVSTGVCTSVLMAIGRPFVIACVTVAGGATQTALAILLTSRFGFVGLAVAFAIGVPAAKTLGLIYMQSRVGIPQNLYVRGARGPYAVGIASALFTLPIGIYAGPMSRGEALWIFVGSSTLFVTLYAFTSWHLHYLPNIPLALGSGRFLTKYLRRNERGRRGGAD